MIIENRELLCVLDYILNSIKDDTIVYELDRTKYVFNITLSKGSLRVTITYADRLVVEFVNSIGESLRIREIYYIYQSKNIPIKEAVNRIVAALDIKHRNKCTQLKNRLGKEAMVLIDELRSHIKEGELKMNPEDMKRWAMCSGKVKHDTMESAEEAVAKFKIKGIKMNAYYCRFCGKYHVGTIESN